MKIEDIQSLVSYRIQKAEESLKAAEIMVNSNMPAFAMNRIYYAMFYAVQAVLALSGVSFSKHGQVKAYLNRELIKKHILPLELGKTYNKAFEYRQKFDYIDFAIPEREMADVYLEAALLNGEVLEKYPDLGLGEICLVLGFSKNIPIHAVCGWRGDKVAIITVYVSKPPKFIDPWTRRK